MTNIIILYHVCAALFILQCATLVWIFENRRNITKNLSYIKQNKELIENNANLIHLINVMLSNSELKVDWKKYSEHLRKLGIPIDDYHRNLDIEDPEG